MKSIFDTVSKHCSRIITQTYSTSFSMATKMLSNSIRQDIYNIYGFVRLADEIVDSFHDYDKKKQHGAWLFTVVLNNKDYVQKKLREHFIETNQVHFRNDRYSIFKKFVKGKKFPNMDFLENKYLVLPLHHKVSTQNAKYICKLINRFAK